MKSINLDLLNKLTDIDNPEFGDYILFQEYICGPYNKELQQYEYTVTKPILAIFIRFDIWDQALVMDYLPWHHDRLIFDNPVILSHAEWNNYANFLGHWKHKPSWKEILYSYRKQDNDI